MKLLVRLAEQACGELEISAAERFRFRYLPDYLAREGIPLSVSMSLREAPWSDEVAFPWFENLLPEGELRFRIAEDLRTDVQNISRLLKRLGGDVAGAVSLHAEGEARANPVDADSPVLDEVALGQLLEESARHPFLAARPDGPRLSLAGAQQKLPVLIRADGLRLPQGSPSTHLLKPPSPRFPALAHNEFVCMRAARLAGLQVADVSLRHYIGIDDRKQVCLQVTRYDRVERVPGQWTRLHQEDICQALSVVSPRKYEADGGPGMAQLFAVIRQHSATPAKDIVELLKRVLFNLLIGNEDAHGKNFSLLYSSMQYPSLQDGPRKPVLAPAYDLVSTALYPQLSRELAMSVGGAQRFAELGVEQLQLFATQTATGPARMRKALRDFLEQANNGVALSVKEVVSICDNEESALLGELVAQCRQRYAVLGDLLG
ncbi:MAG: type II toxin-antitoxin system HipA family toxin [Alcanivoracaceae bacterium]